MAKYCPDCGDVLNGSQDCICGWVDTSKVKQSIDTCAFSIGVRRCPAPGTVTRHVTGASPWYCTAHMENLGDYPTCLNILADYEKNGVPKKIDWRDEILEKRMRGIDTLAENENGG